MSPVLSSQAPGSTGLRLALLPSLTPVSDSPQVVYKRAAQAFSLPESSMPAFRAHLTRRLDALLRTERLPSELRPQLALALVEHLQLKGELGTEGRALARQASLGFRRMEILLGRLVDHLRQPVLGGLSAARGQLTPESKLAITRAIVLEHGRSPLVAGDPRITSIGEQFGATQMQVAALKAWVTMRTESQLRKYEVQGHARTLSSGVIALAGQLESGVYTRRPRVFQAACAELAKRGGVGDADCLLEGTAKELAALLFPNGYGKNTSTDLRAELVEAWGLGEARR